MASSFCATSRRREAGSRERKNRSCGDTLPLVTRTPYPLRSLLAAIPLMRAAHAGWEGQHSPTAEECAAAGKNLILDIVRDEAASEDRDDQPQPGRRGSFQRWTM